MPIRSFVCPTVGAPLNPFLYLAGMTFPWEVPPETVIVEIIDGRWRVVPYKLPVEMFDTRDEAITRAYQIANLFLNAWRVIEKPTKELRRSA